MAIVQNKIWKPKEAQSIWDMCTIFDFVTLGRATNRCMVVMKRAGAIETNAGRLSAK